MKIPSASFAARFPEIKSVSWFPGHMAMANRQIQSQLENIDVVVEVRDARLPFASANPALREVCEKKERIVVLNKADLSNANMRSRVLQAIEEREGVPAMFTTATTRKQISSLTSWCNSNGKSQFKKTAGTMTLVVGVPNVGKSSIINSMRQLSSSKKLSRGRKRAEVGDMPGVTRTANLIKINDMPAQYVVDTPGVMIPKIEDPETGMKLTLIGAIKDEIIGKETLVDYMLFMLNQMNSKRYVDFLGLDSPTDDVDILFDSVMRRSGGTGKSMEQQRIIGANFLLKEFRKGTFGAFTLDRLD